DIQSSDLATRKALGKRYLDANRLDEAIQVFAQILRENPTDLESYLFLGDCYMIGGDVQMALLFYNQAKSMTAQTIQVDRRIQLAKLKKFISYDESNAKISDWIKDQPTLPTQPMVVAEILEQLTSTSSSVSEEEVLNAAKLLKEIIYSPHPALMVAERLDEINELIPALLELNIRQARADGRFDLVEGLQNLLQNIQLQKQNQISEFESANHGKKVRPDNRPLKVLLLDGDPKIPLLRSPFPSQELQRLDCEVAVFDPKQGLTLDQFDVLVAVHPHLNAQIMEILAQAHAAKKPIVVYLEVDFEQMPLAHPAFEVAGLGSPSRAKAYSAACLLADLICVPSDAFAKSLRQSGFNVAVIPPAWNEDNLPHTRPNQTRHTINLGWIGFADELEDVFQVKRMIVRVMREFPQTQLIIAGDGEVYQLFDNLPEGRRLFIPLLQDEDLGYALNQMDILLLPLRNNPFHHSLSDYRLVAAGGRGIPWIASPLPTVMNWGEGGLIINSTDEWHTYLRQLVLDDDLRRTLGEAGRRLAELRSTIYQSKIWQKLLLELTGEKEV
ncbi:MAG: tetratricopeptide repeat protein, partial [Anaerolineales bacterium]